MEGAAGVPPFFLIPGLYYVGVMRWDGENGGVQNGECVVFPSGWRYLACTRQVLP